MRGSPKPKTNTELAMKLRDHQINCIIRTDIPIGYQAAFLIHAAGESARLVNDLPHNTHAVALAAKNETELRTVCDQMVKAGVALRPIVENEGDYDGQLMAIGIAPCSKEAVKRFLSTFPLVKEPS